MGWRGESRLPSPLAFLPPLPVQSQPVITVFMVKRW